MGKSFKLSSVDHGTLLRALRASPLLSLVGPHGPSIPSAVAGVVPVGCIIVYSGNPTNIPAGWALCDGVANAPGPDLSAEFIIS